MSFLGCSRGLHGRQPPCLCIPIPAAPAVGLWWTQDAADRSRHTPHGCGWEGMRAFSQCWRALLGRAALLVPATLHICACNLRAIKVATARTAAGFPQVVAAALTVQRVRRLCACRAAAAGRVGRLGILQWHWALLARFEELLRQGSSPHTCLAPALPRLRPVILEGRVQDARSILLPAATPLAMSLLLLQRLLLLQVRVERQGIAVQVPLGHGGDLD